MTNPKYMNSGRPRLADDDYKTLDKRCVYGFLEFFQPVGLVIDPCSPSGSGIVNTLKELDFNAEGLSDAFADFQATWVVSNPPYKRRPLVNGVPLVDAIIYRQIDRIHVGDVFGVAMLLRHGFDFAQERKPMFRDNPYYAGQIKLLFRPRWFEKRPGDKQPFHQYVWHIWHAQADIDRKEVWYAEGREPETLAVA